MRNSKFSVFVMYAVLLVVFLGLINMVFDLHRFAFFGEFLILGILFVVAIVSILGAHNNFSWAWKLLNWFFVFVFLNMIFIKAISTSRVDFFLPLLVAAVAGFFIAFFNVVELKESKKAKKSKKDVKKTFKPGKYIASKSGAKYHAPKCDWAKRVKKKNAVWFNNKEEAKKAGYKADSCVK